MKLFNSVFKTFYFKIKIRTSYDQLVGEACDTSKVPRHAGVITGILYSGMATIEYVVFPVGFVLKHLAIPNPSYPWRRITYHITEHDNRHVLSHHILLV